jgi:hypothetical protein
MSSLIDSDLKQRVSRLVQNYSLDKCSPDVNIVNEIFSFDASDDLGSLTLNDISRFLVVLSQYSLSLTYKRNSLSVQKSFLSKKLEKLVIRNMSSLKGGTKDERRRKAIDDDEAMTELEHELELISSELHMIEDFPDAVKEYINALKKQRDTKELEIRNARYEVPL